MIRHAAGLGIQNKFEYEPLASVPRLDWLCSSRRAILSGIELGDVEVGVTVTLHCSSYRAVGFL
jgi:hypothetical protein